MNMDGARNGEEMVVQVQQQDPQHRPRPPENHAVAHDRHNLLPPPSCPRCDSSNTKFCYYNNYSLSQPRYFCKACRRYWTQGGSLRTVPIGGGCRKTKRPRISPSSASLWSGLIPRAQGLSNGGARSQSLLPGLMSRHPLPVAPPLGGGSFYPGGSYLSTLAAMQSLPLPPGGINQGAVPVMGGGGGRFGSNMALLQGMTFPSLKSPAPLHQQLPPQTHFFPPPQQGLLPPGRFSSWSQNVLNTGVDSSSAAVTPGMLNSGGAASGSDQAAAPSFSPNPSWSDYNPGFNHSQ